MSHEAGLICRLVDINFEFIKGVGKWPSGRTISPPNLELIRDCGRLAESHAEALIEEHHKVIKQRDDLLAAAKAALAVLQGDPVQWCQSETKALAVAVARAALAGGETGETE